MVFNSHDMKPATCPKCGKQMDAATNLTGTGAPDPGDFTACLYCAAVLLFEADASLRCATRQELAQMALEDPGSFNLLMAVVSIIGGVRTKLNAKQGETT